MEGFVSLYSLYYKSEINLDKIKIKIKTLSQESTSNQQIVNKHVIQRLSQFVVDLLCYKCKSQFQGVHRYMS